MRFVTADDSRITATVLASQLRELGHSVIAHAFNGQDAVALCRLHHPDVVILDVIMPPMNGDEAAEIIQREKLAETILIATSQGQGHVDALVASLGAKLVRKPYAPGMLAKVIEEIALSAAREGHREDRSLVARFEEIARGTP